MTEPTEPTAPLTDEERERLSGILGKAIPKNAHLTKNDTIPVNISLEGPITQKMRDRRAQRELDWSKPLIPAANNVCPRCRDTVPVPGKPGEYEGARSRTDNVTEVCSRCGEEEAYEDMGDKLVPQDQWPVRPRRDMSNWNASRGMLFSVATPRPMPKEVPDLRLHLLDRWVEGGVFWQATELRTTSGQVGGPTSMHAMWERETLANASLWWIKDEMMQVTLAASQTIPEDTTGQDVLSGLPQPYGMAVLERTWIGVDSSTGEPGVRVDVFTWGTSRLQGQRSLSMSAYRYLDFGMGMNTPEMQEALATGAFYEAQAELQKAAGGKFVSRLRGGAWMYLGRSDWPLGDTVMQPYTEPDRLASVPGTAERMASVQEDRRVLAAFSVLITHKLSERETVYAQRQIKRRAERAGVKDKDTSNVTLVRLREVRKQRDDGEPDGPTKHVEYSHRWLSSGHIGWRWYGKGKKAKHLVWIPPSIKGPQDKPLVVKERVNLWVR